MKKILFLAPKPPPVSGLANISKSLYEVLNNRGYKVSYCSTVPSFAANLYPGLIWQFVRMVYFLFWLLPKFLINLPSKDLAYINLNGGNALFFDMIFVAVSRLFGKPLILHHNSFSYLNEYTKLAAIVFRFAGPKARHIVNCVCMQTKLESLYELDGQGLLLSNISILGARKKAKSLNNKLGGSSINNAKLCIGFMGYYTEEKGIDLFCETIRLAKKQGAAIEATAAGIVHDRSYFERISGKYGDIVNFCGPQYGEAKDSFFAGLDILLFPSKYRTEAEPLIVYDALSTGIPVFSTDVGCLTEMLETYSHCRSSEMEAFAFDASQYLVEWSKKTKKDRMTIKKEVKFQYENNIAEKNQQLERYLDVISG